MALSFNEYQAASADTRVYPSKFKIVYPTMGLAGEAGEVSEKVKKVLRDDNGNFSDEKLEQIALELSDCLWYIAALADDLGFELGDIAQRNLDKLQSRKERNVLQGSGDNR